MRSVAIYCLVNINTIGIVKSLWYLLLVGYYFSQPQREAFDSFVSSVEWPSGIGRLPKNVSRFYLERLNT